MTFTTVIFLGSEVDSYVSKQMLSRVVHIMEHVFPFFIICEECSALHSDVGYRFRKKRLLKVRFVPFGLSGASILIYPIKRVFEA